MAPASAVSMATGSGNSAGNRQVSFKSEFVHLFTRTHDPCGSLRGQSSFSISATRLLQFNKRCAKLCFCPMPVVVVYSPQDITSRLYHRTIILQVFHQVDHLQPLQALVTSRSSFILQIRDELECLFQSHSLRTFPMVYSHSHYQSQV